MAADKKPSPFVSFGTPLEPLEEDEALKKPIPLHEQTVRDEKGRYQRFHGAFTGGFSAGYFNTVGSKEGWSPATFKSSRQQKAEKQEAAPEDFMDEEDFGEHGIAPREITTQQEFRSNRADPVQERAKAINAQAGLIPGDTMLGDLIAPARSSVGVELLRRMGWREGQGVGPRVKKRPRRKQTDNRVYGCALPPAGSEESEEEDDEFAPENVTFAPKDVTPVDFNPRIGLQGLGYCGLDPGRALGNSGPLEHVNLFSTQSESRSRLFGDASRGQQRRGGVAGQAFGVGALEDEDEDVYSRDCISRYDTELKDEEPGDNLYGWTAPEEYKKKTTPAIKSRDASYLGRILEGFTLSQNQLEQKQIFPPPELPKDYRPLHRRPGVHVSHLFGVSPALAEAMRVSKGHMAPEEPEQPAGRHQLDSDQRRGLLGEDGLKGPTSVMDLLRPEDRERLLRLRMASGQGPPAPPPPPPPPVPQPPPVQQPRLVLHPPPLAQESGFPLPYGTSAQEAEALSAWKGRSTTHAFKPFDNNPSKQARYDQYLERLRLGERDALNQSLDEGMTEWERSREKEEFVRASILYRPSSSSMLASRFTRAAQGDEDDTTVEVIPETQDLSDKKAAVRMKMFGQLTRETLEFHPDKILCRRFNVPHPYPGSNLVGVPKVRRDKFSVFNFLTVTEDPSGPKKPTPAPVKKSRWDMSEQDKKDSLVEKEESPEVKEEPPASPPVTKYTPAEDESESEKDEDEEEEEEEVEEEVRLPMDLFKAIFDSSSSSSEDSEEEDQSQEQVQDQTTADPQPFNLFSITSSAPEPPSSQVASSSAPPPSVTPSTAAPPSSLNSANQQTEAASSCQRPTLDDEEFGPKLPPSFHDSKGGASETNQSSVKKHKKQKKEKKKKKKSKHKKKQKKKAKEAESESSGESSQDEDGKSTDLLMKRLKDIREANRK